MIYTVQKQRGSNRYYVTHVNDKNTPLSPFYPEKRKALKAAAKMEGISYKQYLRLRKTEVNI